VDFIIDYTKKVPKEIISQVNMKINLHFFRKIGVKYLSVTWRATDGYPTNTYITILPDNSILDFYTKYADRQEKTAEAKMQCRKNEDIKCISTDGPTLQWDNY
jgi:hypothetical protein